MSFNSLFPTVFMHEEILETRLVNTDLKNLILEMNKNIPNLTEEYKNNNFFAVRHNAVQWLIEAINIHVSNYIRYIGINYNLDYSLFGWSNVNLKGDYHVPHNHPHSWLSGVYYVSMPNQQNYVTHRKDLAPSHISFFDPRPQANMNSIEGDQQNRDEYRVLPKEGALLLFPSFLQHMAHPNISDSPRVSISFNVNVTLQKPS